jgi:excisionase family DNA binding protein
VAEVCSISRRKVYSLIETGDLPSVRIGSSARVAESDLAAFIEGKRGPTREDSYRIRPRTPADWRGLDPEDGIPEQERERLERNR